MTWISVSERLPEIISLGAGVQSSTIALMAARGEITPMPTAAIFADTQQEKKASYPWLDWLEKQLPFPVRRVTAGNLGEKSLVVKKSKNGNYYTSSSIPAFITDGEKTGILMRQCTTDFKIVPIYREIRRLIGRSRKAKAIQWIGISLDEALRSKPSRKKWVENRWPLLELKMTRADCVSWMKKNGYPTPPRSACVFCPFHSDNEWMSLKTESPEDFNAAVKFEKDYQFALKQIPTIRGVPFLHRSCRPLSEVVFNAPTKQLNLFINECEGMCGV